MIAIRSSFGFSVIHVVVAWFAIIQLLYNQISVACRVCDRRQKAIRWMEENAHGTVAKNLEVQVLNLR